jgi:hypothetical protein
MPQEFSTTFELAEQVTDELDVELTCPCLEKQQNIELYQHSRGHTRRVFSKYCLCIISWYASSSVSK